jgi:hypothetical protein
MIMIIEWCSVTVIASYVQSSVKVRLNLVGVGGVRVWNGCGEGAI